MGALQHLPGLAPVGLVFLVMPPILGLFFVVFSGYSIGTTVAAQARKVDSTLREVGQIILDLQANCILSLFIQCSMQTSLTIPAISLFARRWWLLVNRVAVNVCLGSK